jgi:hypothetical protein
MAAQIRLVLTVDAGVKQIIESAATEFAGGNISSYIRGLALLHQLLLGHGTGHSDIPGWLLGHYPLDLIAELREILMEAKKPSEAVQVAFTAHSTLKPRPKPAKK